MLRRLFTPRMLALHLAAVLATAAAIGLGLWQYDVWQRGRAAQANTLVHAAPVRLGSVITADSAFPGASVGQPVTFRGRWMPRSTLYVDHRRLHGREGVWVVTPVAVCSRPSTCDRASAMLVVRGWARSAAAAPAAPTGSVAVAGWLQPGESSSAGDPDPADRVLSQLRIADAIQYVDRDLYGGYVIARRVSPASTSSPASSSTSSAAASSLRPVTPAALPAPSSFTSVRNLLYAAEWWFFGGFAVFMWWRWCRDEVSRVTGVPSHA